MPLSQSDSTPPGPTLSRTVTPVATSCAKMSDRPVRSPATRVGELLSKTTIPPFEVIAGRDSHRPLPWAPDESTLTRIVVPWKRSRSKQSGPFVSFGTRSDAKLMNATYPPSGEIAAQELKELPLWPPSATLTSV